MGIVIERQVQAVTIARATEIEEVPAIIPSSIAQYDLTLHHASGAREVQ